MALQSTHMVAIPSDQGSGSAAAGSFPIEGPPETPSPRCDVRNALLLLRLVPFEEVNDSFPIKGCFINASFTAKRRDVKQILDACEVLHPEPSRFALAKRLALDCGGVIVVYQAFNRQIAQDVVNRQTFTGCPLYNPLRMTWIKTSYCWMNYRAEFGTRDANQERILAITIPLSTFDEILRRSVHDGSALGHASGAGECQRTDPVRLQWDPDHTPQGEKRQRRTIQLGLRGAILEVFHNAIVAIDDITDRIVAPNRPAKFRCQAARSCFRVGDGGAAQQDDSPGEGNERDTDVAYGRSEDQADKPARKPRKKAAQKRKEEKGKARDADVGMERARNVGEEVILQPFEALYVPNDPSIADRIGLSIAPDHH